MKPDKTILLLFSLLCGTADAAAYRTANFVVSAPTPELAQEVGDAAERTRASGAMLWFGRQLPKWSQPCPIHVRLTDSSGGGQTQFRFDRGEVFGWQMDVEGTRDALLKAVIPHEVTHTLFASVFRRALPRWLDEGGCSTTESPNARKYHNARLVEYLRSNRGIAFNRMVGMYAYPQDIHPLYAQGHSVATFLIEHGGHQEFVRFADSGFKTGWGPAVKQHYGYADMGELQTTWLEWVKQGSPESGVTKHVAYQGSCASGQCFGGGGWHPASQRPSLAGPTQPPPTFVEEEPIQQIPVLPKPVPQTPVAQVPVPQKPVKGDKGDPGESGKDGRDGKDADQDAIVAAIVERLRAQPIKFDLVKTGPDGKPQRYRQETTLGGDPIELQLTPKNVK